MLAIILNEIYNIILLHFKKNWYFLFTTFFIEIIVNKFAYLLYFSVFQEALSTI